MSAIQILRTLLFSAICFFGICSPASAWKSHDTNDEASTIQLVALPPEARHTIELIRRGGPFPYRRDGITFQNREKRLPPRQRGYYKEYTVPTPGERDRGARRIITGAPDEFYYSPDHYRSFRRVQP